MKTSNVLYLVLISNFLQRIPAQTLPAVYSPQFYQQFFEDTLNSYQNFTVKAMKTAINSKQLNEYKELLKSMHDILNEKRIAEILQKASDRVVSMPGSEINLNNLWTINNSEFQQLFDIMVAAEMRLYETSANNFTFANMLGRIKNDNSLLKNTDSSLRSKVYSTAWKKLPKSLPMLILRPTFCIANDHYGTFPYTATLENASDKRKAHKIWLWHEINNLDATSRIKAEVLTESANSKNQLKVSLKGDEYNMYYYMNSTSREVLGWNAEGSPPNYKWNVLALNDNFLRIYQSSYILCAMQDLDGERRALGVRQINAASVGNNDCIWMIQDCPFDVEEFIVA